MQVNEALASDERPEGKEAYGAKAKHIQEMYEKYVPPQFDSPYAPSASGASGGLRPTVVQQLRTPADNAAAVAAKEKAAAKKDAAAQAKAAGVPEGNKKVRWNSSIHQKKFKELYEKLAPNTTKEWKALADQMFDGCEPSQCKTALKKLQKLQQKQPASAAVAPEAAKAPAKDAATEGEVADETAVGGAVDTPEVSLWESPGEIAAGKDVAGEGNVADETAVGDAASVAGTASAAEETAEEAPESS